MTSQCSEQDTFNISEVDVPVMLNTTTDMVLLTVVIPLILALGVITNTSFLFVIYRAPRIRSDTSVYLAHLAAADLTYLTLQASMEIWGFVASPDVLSTPFANSASCCCFFLVSNTAYYASIALVTAVSYDRYLAMCHPLKQLRMRGLRRTYQLVAICWLVGFLFSIYALPIEAVYKRHCLQWPDGEAYAELPSTTAFCDAVQPWVHYYVEPVQHIPWIFAMAANVYMYVRIIHRLHKRRNLSSGSRHVCRALWARNQMAKMLIINGVVFFACQAPYTIANLWEWICCLIGISNPLYLCEWQSVNLFFYIPIFLNNAVNPLIYGVLNTQYRAAFVQAFRCKWRSRSQAPLLSIASGSKDARSASSSKTITNHKVAETCL